MIGSPDLGDGETLDPEDWGEFRAAAHAALDHCIDYLATVRERPVWQPPSGEMKLHFAAPVPHQGTGLEAVLKECRDWVMPFATGNIHPRFFGWVHGSGTPVGIISELMTATMNSNCGGRDHGGIYVERQVIDWCKEIFGLPKNGSGVLTVGTSAAGALAVSVARAHHLGTAVRRGGNAAARRLVGYASEEVHVAAKKAFELLGLGSDNLRAVPTERNHAIALESLRQAILADRVAGLDPFLVIGSAGTVNTGAYDDLGALAEIAAAEKLWFHVDGAFGAWARIAGEPWSALVRGIERADSLAFDFHKWISAPYDAGCLLVRDGDLHRAAFAERPNYLTSAQRGLAAGEPWPTDFGIDLSRGFRAMKVWMTFKRYGVVRLGRMIAKNCRCAEYLAALIGRSACFEIAAPVSLNICCFRLRNVESPERNDELIGRLVEELQVSGIAAPSSTRIDGRLCVRVAILNHRTHLADLDLLTEAAERILAQIAV